VKLPRMRDQGACCNYSGLRTTEPSHDTFSDRFGVITRRTIAGEGIDSLTMKIVQTIAATLSVLGIVFGTGCDFCKPKESSGRSAERLTLGTVPVDAASLVWVAKRQGYFAQQEVDIDIRLYETGNLAVQDLRAGKLDLATALVFVTLRHCIQCSDLRIIAGLVEGQTHELVARRDRGITAPVDLKNKRVGISRSTSSEYYFNLMMLLANVKPEDVRIVDLLPFEQVGALLKGDIDAGILYEPYSSRVKKELGSNAVSWSAQSGQNDYGLLVGTRETIEKRSDAIARFLTALASAESLINNDRGRAMAIVAKELGDKHVASSWKNLKFELSLHRPLVLKMEAELRWLRSASDAPKSNVPDVYQLIYFDALRAVANEKIGMTQ